MFKACIEANDLDKFNWLYHKDPDFISFLTSKDSIIVACEHGSHNLLREMIGFQTFITQETKLTCANVSSNAPMGA